MVASDLHLGYKEKSALRENDSYEAFEEILVKSKQMNADLLLLGGDLFHDLDPS